MKKPRITVSPPRKGPDKPTPEKARIGPVTRPPLPPPPPPSGRARPK